jgi:hypothetical protein
VREKEKQLGRTKNSANTVLHKAEIATDVSAVSTFTGIVQTNDVFEYLGCFCTNVHVFLHVKGGDRSDYKSIQTRIKEHPIIDSQQQKYSLGGTA